MQVARQIDLGFGLGDRRVLRIAEMAVANRPEACGADVGNGGDLDATSDLALEPLEALGQLYGCLRHFDHGRTRSNTRPRNQKFSTPAHRAWSASVQAYRTATPQPAPPVTAAATVAVLAAQYSAMNQ